MDCVLSPGPAASIHLITHLSLRAPPLRSSYKLSVGRADVTPLLWGGWRGGGGRCLGQSGVQGKRVEGNHFAILVYGGEGMMWKSHSALHLHTFFIDPPLPTALLSFIPFQFTISNILQDYCSSLSFCLYIR